MLKFCKLGYIIYVAEDYVDVKAIQFTRPEKIDILGFDTETNSLIDKSRIESNLMDIRHDRPFQVQFGYDKIIFVVPLAEWSAGIINILREYIKVSTLTIAHNIRFDINMLKNEQENFEVENGCDTMSIVRLANEAVPADKGGVPMKLKMLAKRFLGSEFVEADKEVDIELDNIWKAKLNALAKQLKPFGYTKAKVNEILKDVTFNITDFPPEVQAIWLDWEKNKFVSYDMINKTIMQEYGAVDVILILELARIFLPIVQDRNQTKILKREMQLIPVLVDMERTGYEVDVDYVQKSRERVINEIKQITKINDDTAGIHLEAQQNKAIQNMIIEKFGYELTNTDKTNIHILINTDTKMPTPAKEYLNNVLYLRTLKKWLVTYIDSILFKITRSGDTKVYTQYNPNGAVSGRFTSNFQQFPKYGIASEINGEQLYHPRKMFTVNKGFEKIAYIDYSQIELRIQAEYTYYSSEGDLNMLRAYMPFKCYQKDDKWYHKEDHEEWHKLDLHTQSTMSAFPEVPLDSEEFKKLRNIGKRVNFAMVYGSGLKTITEILADTPPHIITKLYSGFANRFKGVKLYGNWVNKQWVNNSGYVQNLFGRRYYLSDPAGVYKLNNYMIQGSAADLIKLAMIAIHSMLKKGGYKSKLQGTIHDELCICIFEGEDEVISKVKEIMEKIAKTYVPIVAEVETTSTSWAEKS